MRVCIGESDVVAPGRLKAKLAAVLARHGMVSARVAEVRSLRGLVEEIAALRFLDALCGDTPTIAFRPADPADPRFRLLRDLPGMGARPRADRLARLWLRDHRRCILFHAIIRSSAWLNDRPISLTVAELARLSALSAQSVMLILAEARNAGEIVTARAEPDRRRLLIEPGAALRALADQRRHAHTGLAAELTGRADPSPRLTGEAEHAWRRLHAELSVNKLGPGVDRGRRLAVARRALLLWDLVTEGPQRTRDFLPRQQIRSRASRQTICNHLAWLRAEGWLAAGEPLTATPFAHRRFAAMLGTFEACAQRVLDLLDLLAERPRDAACIVLPPRLTACPASWLRCRWRVHEDLAGLIAAVGKAGERGCAAAECPLAADPSAIPAIGQEVRIESGPEWWAREGSNL